MNARQGRIDTLATDVYNFVFDMLDTEPEFTGMEAGKLATEIEQLFRQRMLEHYGERADKSWRV